MKTNLLKLSRKHPVLFSILYGRKMEARRQAREIDKLMRKAKTMADEYWGWDIDRDTYDTCIIAAHILRGIKERATA